MPILSTLFGFGKEQSHKIAVLNAEAYANAISEKKVQLVDVRTAKEYKNGHIENAINIDFYNKRVFEDAFNTLNKEQPVYLYCRSGARSMKAARKLVDMGFSKIYDLEGGYRRWSSSSRVKKVSSY